MFSKLIKSPRRKVFRTFLHGQKGHSVAVRFLKFWIVREKWSDVTFWRKKTNVNNKAPRFARRLKNIFSAALSHSCLPSKRSDCYNLAKMVKLILKRTINERIRINEYRLPIFTYFDLNGNHLDPPRDWFQRHLRMGWNFIWFDFSHIQVKNILQHGLKDFFQ